MKYNELPLYKHQQELIELNPKKHLLAWCCGSSKTRTVIELAGKNNIDKALVIVPKSLVFNFEKELDKWKIGNTDFTIITKETFRRDWDKLPKYDCLIIDEAHTCSGMTGFRKKSQLLRATLAYCKKHNPQYRWLATATPYMSSVFSLYALAEILGYKMNYQAFKKKFFNEFKLGSMRYPILKQKENIEEDAADFVKKIGSTVKMNEIFDVPTQTEMQEYFEVTPEQKKGIKQLETTVPIAYYIKSHQIINGTLKGNEYEDDLFFKSEKLQRALQLCEEHKKIAIVCKYKLEIEAIKSKLKRKDVYTITGDTTTEEKRDIVKTVADNDNCVVLISSACCEGYSLSTIPIMVFYSLDFSLKNFIQMQGRILRSNNLKKNVYIFFIIKDTIDEDVYKCIMKKNDFQIEIYKSEKR